jgi:cupin fold WbuC family metalloprotein
MTDDPILSLNDGDLAALTAAAEASPRRRSHRNLHADFSDPVQRLLIAAEPDTYVQPHRHPAKPWEMIVLIRGAMDVLMFADDGKLERRVALRADGDRMIQYPGTQYHGAVVCEPGTVILEVKQGPYDAATAKQTPAWAPGEDAPEGAAYRDRMRDLAVGDA